ncbi:hypothetical protein VTN00DRAFT_3702 [Thermoascus crustaceus]|uniref:uncharacterized protein n=1 Tax=Thermoascus crustaceus TaxID=5088 RepID=UPI0037433290
MASWSCFYPRTGGNTACAPPKFVKFRSSKAFIVGVVTIAVFTDIFLYGVIVPVTPTALEERVGLPPEDRQKWVSILLALYGAALLTSSPIFGYMADKTASRQWPLILGLVALGASTGLLCAGTTLGLWIAGRIFQGLSAAMVWTVGLALLVDTVGKDEIGSAMGFIGMGVSAGTMLGPLLGGVIYQRGGYYSVFAVAFALIGVDIVLRLVMIEKKDAQKWLSAAEDSASSEEESTHQNTEEKEARAESYAPTSTAENSADTPHEEPSQESVPKRRLPSTLILLSNRRMLFVLYSYLAISILMTSFDSVLPLFVQATFGWEQIGQGLAFTPLFVPHFFEPLIGRIIDRYKNSPRFLAAGAFFFSTPVYVLLRFVTHKSMDQKVLLCALLSLIGISVSTALPSLMTEVSYIINHIEEKSPNAFGPGGAMAQGYGIFNSAFAAGSLVGPVWAGFCC